VATDGSCRGWWTCTVTSGWYAQGPAPVGGDGRQALSDRDAGALLLRDAGVGSDTRWMDEREDLPRWCAPVAHRPPKRYQRNWASEVEPAELVDEVCPRLRAATAGVKIVGDWIDRESGT